MEPSRRKRLLELAETGRLRQTLEYATPHIDEDVIDLIVDLAIRYSEPRPRRKEGARDGE